MDFPFYDAPNTAAIICCHILENGKPILYVSHDEDDGMWRFLCGSMHDTAEARLVSLKSVFDLDNSVGILKDMPCGYYGVKGSEKLIFRGVYIMFEGFDFTNFWEDSAYALKEYVSESPSDELIASVEQELGYKLPASYIWLMKQHNGGIPVNTCFPTDNPTSWADDYVSITGILGIGREKTYSLCGELGSQFMIEEWGYPAIGVAICDSPSAGHDMIFLDYRECGTHGEPKVVHIDQEWDYKITPLADTFEDFIRGLINEYDFELEN